MAGTSITMEWSGFQEFEDLLTEMEQDFSEKDQKNILRNALRTSIQPVKNSATSILESNGNVDTGQLLQSIQIEVRKPTGRDKRSSYVSPTMIMIARVSVAPGSKFKPKLFKNIKNTKTKMKQYASMDSRALAIEFGTAKFDPGQGKPFIRPALESNQMSVTQLLASSLGAALTKYRSKHMRTTK